MAIGGGGSGGGPVGISNSFTGPAQALEYNLDFAYAYSGPINANSSTSADTPMFDFVSGSNLMIGTIAFQTNEVANNVIYFDVIMNGSSILQGAWDNSGSGQATANTPIDIVIPPYTQVKVNWGITGGAGADATCQIIGRVYRG